MATKRRWRITEEEAIADALKCTTRTEFATRFSGSWRHLSNKGFCVLDKACKHMTGHTQWSERKVLIVARRFKTRNNFKKGNNRAYLYAQQNGLLVKCYAHMGPPEKVGRKKKLNVMSAKSRPDVPKLDVLTIGGFTDDGKPDKHWSFDGKSHPNSVGIYLGEGWELYGGYTINELKELKV